MTDGYEGYPNIPPYMPWLIEPEEAPHLGHMKHLCEMARRGVDLNTYKELVKDAKFICKKCGRVAVNEDNLCEPVPL